MTDAINDPFRTTDDVNYLEELVGEGKKFGTIEDLAKGKFHADTMIETLKAEINTLKTSSANGTNIDTLLEEIRKINAGKTGDNNGQPIGDAQVNPPPQNIEEIVLSTLTKTEQARKAQENEQKSVAKMQEVWGKDASKELSRVASTLGLTKEKLLETAQQSPEAFFTLTGLNSNRSPASGTTVPTSSVRFESNGTGKRDAKYYRELKKTNPTAYKDSKTQVQMHRDALQLGEEFFN